MHAQTWCKGGERERLEPSYPQKIHIYQCHVVKKFSKQEPFSPLKNEIVRQTPTRTILPMRTWHDNAWMHFYHCYCLRIMIAESKYPWILQQSSLMKMIPLMDHLNWRYQYSYSYDKYCFRIKTHWTHIVFQLIYIELILEL